MVNKMVAGPSVQLIVKPAINVAGLNTWVAEQELDEIASDPTTPLGRFVEGANNGTTTGDEISEFAGRFCYNSWRKGRDTQSYIANIIESGHGSVLQHVNYGFAISGISRALSHELIRHHAGTAPSQESQRYVNADEVRFVVPPILMQLWNNNLSCQEALDWLTHQEQCVENYKAWRDYIVEGLKEEAGFGEELKPSTLKKRANEAARYVLPNAAETKIFWTTNVRALRNIIEQRGGDGADLEIRRLAIEMLRVIESQAEHSFADIDTAPEGKPTDFGIERIEVAHSKV